MASSMDQGQGMIREARSSDCEAVIRLYHQLNLDDPWLEDGSDVAAFEQILATPGLHLFVLELDGVVVGSGSTGQGRSRPA